MTTHLDILDSVGDLNILKLRKTAFLCSRRIPAGLILKCYDWAIAQRDAGRCVIGGFHSTIEKDVFHYLAKGNQPIIMALHRGIGSKIENEFADQIRNGQLLIVSPFNSSKRRGDSSTAAKRNRLMLDIADEVVVGHASPGGQLERLLSHVERPLRFI